MLLRDWHVIDDIEAVAFDRNDVRLPVAEQNHLFDTQIRKYL